MAGTRATNPIVGTLPSGCSIRLPEGPSRSVIEVGIVSYDHKLLCERVSVRLKSNPNSSLTELCRELRVSRSTLQNAVIAVTGKRFRDLKDELFLAKVKSLFASRSNATIREVSLEAGYKSPRSFARAVRRASGVSPQQLRSHIASNLRAFKAKA